jgi:hypothetical protein
MYEPDYSVDPRSLTEEEHDAMREQLERDDEPRSLPPAAERLRVADWWVRFGTAFAEQVLGDHVVEDAGHAAMLSGWTPQRFAAELATRLQADLQRRPVRVL